MVTLVVSINILIALFCFYLAWRIWQAKRILSQAADLFSDWQQITSRAVVGEALPNSLLKGQQSAAQWRQQYAQMQRQMQQMRRLVALMGLLAGMVKPFRQKPSHRVLDVRQQSRQRH